MSKEVILLCRGTFVDRIGSGPGKWTGNSCWYSTIYDLSVLVRPPMCVCILTTISLCLCVSASGCGDAVLSMIRMLR